MRYKISLLAMLAATLLTACGQSAQNSSNTTTVSQSNTTTTVAPVGGNPTNQSSNAPPIAPAHGGMGNPSSTSNTSSTSEKPSLDTAALDAKIEKAEAKAKAKGATAADKRAAAAAYLERANVFYNAGTPSLYKFALRDFRIALRYDPTNEEARGKRDQIVEIYQSLNKPVPELGNEQ